MTGRLHDFQSSCSSRRPLIMELIYLFSMASGIVIPFDVSSGFLSSSPIPVWRMPATGLKTWVWNPLLCLALISLSPAPAPAQGQGKHDHIGCFLSSVVPCVSFWCAAFVKAFVSVSLSLWLFYFKREKSLFSGNISKYLRVKSHH